MTGRDQPNRLASEPRRRRARQTAGAVAVAMLVATGCSSGHTSDAASTSTVANTAKAPTTRASSSTSSTSGQGLVSAILNGYRAEQAAFYAAVSQYPVDPLYPGLQATMTGNELTTVRDRLTIAKFQGQYSVGTTDLDPVLTSISPGGTVATISDCLFDHSRIVYGPTGATISGPDSERTLKHITMELDHGTWKVAGDVKAGSGCHPGDR